MSLRGVILLLWFLPSVPMCFFRPFYGVICWTIIAFLNPQWYAWGASRLLPWALVVAIPTILGFVLFSNGWDRFRPRECLLIVVLWIWFVITSVITTSMGVFQHHAADTWGHLIFVSKILLMVFITIGVVDSFARLRNLVIVIAGVFGFFVAKSLPFMITTGGAYKLYGPEHSMIGDNNDFGLALNMTLPLFFFLAQTESKPWMKRLFGALFLGTIPAIFFTYSRGALVGLIAILVLMMLRLKQRFLLVPVVLAGMAVAVLFAPEAWRERMDPTREGAMDHSAMSRITAWTFSWHLVKDYPITGGGFATFTRELFARYSPNPGDIHGAHSIYFEVLGEHGFIGLFLYLAVPVSCFVSLNKVVKWARFYGDEVAISYANMFRFSLVGFGASGLFLGRAYFDYYFTIVACIVVLTRVCFLAWSEAESDELLDESEELEPDLAGGTVAGYEAGAG